jgi:hypothetical protein
MGGELWSRETPGLLFFGRDESTSELQALHDALTITCFQHFTCAVDCLKWLMFVFVLNQRAVLEVESLGRRRGVLVQYFMHARKHVHTVCGHKSARLGCFTPKHLYFIH